MIRKKSKRKRAREVWHRWYAWRPVKIDTKQEGFHGYDREDEYYGALVWFEWIERRSIDRNSPFFYYRIPVRKGLEKAVHNLLTNETTESTPTDT